MEKHLRKAVFTQIRGPEIERPSVAAMRFPTRNGSVVSKDIAGDPLTDEGFHRPGIFPVRGCAQTATCCWSRSDSSGTWITGATFFNASSGI